MDHSSCIYSITNTVNGKRYVGQTSDYTKRMNSHLSSLRGGRSHNRHLQAAFNKYGEDSFRFDVIEYCDIDQLNDREQYWIESMGTYRDGYNLDQGGAGIRGYHYTDEQKQRISNALKGRTFSDEARAKMSKNHADFSGQNNPVYGIPWAQRTSTECQASMKQKLSQCFSGCNNPNYGKTMSDEQKAKLSAAHIKWYQTHENPLKGRKRPEISDTNSYRAHSVVCVNTGELFQTIDRAAAAYHVSQGTISMCVSGKLHTAGKDANGTPLIWRDADEYVPMSSDEINCYLSENKEARSAKIRRKVKCITTGEVFDSMHDACEKYCLDPSSLSAHCRHKKGHASCGYDPDTNERLHWEYVE